MAFQPKAEPGSPPFLASNDHRNLKQMTISELVQVLRVAWQTEDYDRVEEVLMDREAKLKAEIGPLQVKYELERLTRIKAEEELKKKEEQCEKGKRAQVSYETLMKEVKKNGFIDKSTIDDLRKKNKELECENHKLMELKKKLEGDGNVVVELRKRVSELENEKIGLQNEKIGLEDEKKKNLATIDELKCEKRKLVDENKKACAKFAELIERVVKLEGDSKLLMMSESANVGENTRVEPKADPKVAFVVKDEVDVGGSAPFQRSKDTRQSFGASAGEKSGRENVIMIDSDDDDMCISRAIQAKMVESHKRKLSYSDTDNGSSSSGSLNFDDLPLSSHGKFSISKKSK